MGRKRQPGEPGFYPGYHTLDSLHDWDEATQKTVLARVNQSTELHFFTPEEAGVMQAVVDRLVPQDDRAPELRIPVLAYIDSRLHQDRGPGFRYEDMPSDGAAYRLGVEAIGAISQHLFERGFTELQPIQQESVLLTIHNAKPPAGAEIWRRMPPDRFWRLIMDDALRAYYSHPYAWDEIGFGGPAYPRGYMRLERGQPEPWEVAEQRYAFNAPEGSLSDAYVPLGKCPHGSGS